MVKFDFLKSENKAPDQLRFKRAADQRLCSRYTDSTSPLLPESEISNLKPSYVVVQTVMCLYLLKKPKTGFLVNWLIISRWTIDRLLRVKRS